MHQFYFYENMPVDIKIFTLNNQLEQNFHKS